MVVILERLGKEIKSKSSLTIHFYSPYRIHLIFRGSVMQETKLEGVVVPRKLKTFKA